MRFERGYAWGAAVVGAVTLAYGAMFFRGEGPVSGPQLDSLLYYRYARAMAEGHPYRLAADEPPSTGSTSHLYPAVLAGLCAFVGTQGLPAAGFASGAVLLALTLWAVALVARRLEPRAAPLAVALTGLSGPTCFALFGQSDMSLFIPLAMGAWAAALHGRARTLGVLLALAAFCRPEGMILAGLMAVMAGGAWLGARRAKTQCSMLNALVSREEEENSECRMSNTECRREDGWGAMLVAGGAGVGAVGVVLGLNWMLTGSMQFQSVAGKGYFHELPFGAALANSLRDLLDVVGGVLSGAGSSRARVLYLLPAGGVLLVLAGLAIGKAERGKSRAMEWWFLSGAAVAVGLVATSGFSGMAHDRYLGWILPALHLYAAVGLVRAGDRMPRVQRIRRGLAALLLAYQTVGGAYFLDEFGGYTQRMAAMARFAEGVHRRLPSAAAVGMVGRSGLAWHMPGRRVANVSGITSPAFNRVGDLLGNIEQLKYHPELRFEYWLTYPTDRASAWAQPFFGAVVAMENRADARDRLALLRADWSLLEGADGPATTPSVAAVAGKERVDRLDVGYEADERAHGREVFSRVPGLAIRPFAAVLPVGERRLIEVGEVVLGAEGFFVRTIPGRGLTAVMRTVGRATCLASEGQREPRRKDFVMAATGKLLVYVDGQFVGPVEFRLESGGAAFEEVAIEIPAARITRERTAIRLVGDHVACGYWFYQ